MAEPNPIESLAVDGGVPVRSKPWPAWPVFPADEVRAATEVLVSGKVNYWTGTVGRTFEQEFAERIGSEHAIACANGTVALELCLHALGVGPGDDVVVPSRTFVATAHAVALLGGQPVFADVDADSGNITPETLEAAITDKTKAAIVVHLGGWPAQMTGITEVCRRRGLKLIEDCTQAHGAKLGSAVTGSFGDISAFSFCQDKIMTTGGEGGMVVTNDRGLFDRAWSRKDHGKSWHAVYEREHPPGFRWLHESVGGNGRLTEMQSAIGRVQLAKLSDWLAQRRRNAERLAKALADHPALRIPAPPSDATHAYYRLYGYLVPEALAPGWDRQRIMAAIAAEGVPISVGSCGEIYREKAFPDTWRPAAPLPVAAAINRTSLAFSVIHTADDADIDDTAAALRKVLGAATAH